MKKKSFCLAAMCMLLVTASCEKANIEVSAEPAKPITLTTKQGEKVAGDNVFSFKLFREVATSKEKENAFISPLSTVMALGMLYNGTSPDARAEMAAALNMSGFSDTEINEYYQLMLQALLSIDPSTAISIANSIWYREDFSVKQTFIDINNKYYDAVVESPFTSDAINKWCAGKTNDRIKTIIEELPADVVMYLINAVYFKSNWQFKFDKKDTGKEIFTLGDGSSLNTDMMNQETTLPYYSDEMMQCLEMPYGNQAFSMVAMLPAEGKTVDDLVDYLDNEAYNTMLSGFQERNVRVKFPRFKQEYSISLKDPVYNLGMHLIFKEGNLGEIAEQANIAVSDIKHKTFVEVNEEGTEAAAVTAVSIINTSASPSPQTLTFFADRPFIYLIKEKSTGAILFIGRMDNPQ